MTGLSSNDIKGILKEAGITVSNTKAPLSTDAQQKILTHIRARRQKPLATTKKKTLSLSSSKSSSNTSSETSVDSLRINKKAIVSLDKKFQKKTTLSSPESTEPKKVKSPPTEKPVTLTVEQVLAARSSEKTPSSDMPKQAAARTGKSHEENASEVIEIPDNISVKQLANQSRLSVTSLIKTFFDLGEMVSEYQQIPYEMAELVLSEHNIIVRQAKPAQHNKKLGKPKLIESTEHVKTRNPIVTIMGHVDHGKTSILDTIQKSNVTSKEAGGITQHIGAWQVNTQHGKITFIDTPGHESFSAMRSRGAQITDIVILVVAADDSVKPQTIEAIQHAKSANVPMIVAINKIDKEDSDLERVRNDLSQQGIISEEWGGDCIFQPVSAKTGEGINDLLESIALQAEVIGLKADFGGIPQGIVIESRLDKGKGPVCTLIVKSGTFKLGQPIYSDAHHGKIRKMISPINPNIKVAEPSEPFELIGLSGNPKPGDTIVATRTDKEAKNKASENAIRVKNETMNKMNAYKNQYFLQKMKQSSDSQELTVLSLILKTDVDGSLEAISDFIEQNNTKTKDNHFHIRLVGKGVGGINSSDVQLALASNSVVIGFNVRPDASAKQQISQHNIKVSYFSIIYELIDYLNLLEQSMTEPDTTEEIIGNAVVKDVFRSSKYGTIAGCIVQDGPIKRNHLARVLRAETVIFTGKIESLRRFQDDVNEVKTGLECGIGIKAYSDIKVGDMIETYIVKERDKSQDLHG
ncbi:MAG: translation initiation factor IF-2 [Pseudomonadota bacterium]|nr:translation initiation factor IF-2 [Pseudomonadota bacterium]